MSGGGVVFAAQTFPAVAGTNPNGMLNMYGAVQNLGANAVIPAGNWMVDGDYTVQPNTGAVITVVGGGLCRSDGVNVRKVLAGRIVRMGS